MLINEMTNIILTVQVHIICYIMLQSVNFYFQGDGDWMGRGVNS